MAWVAAAWRGSVGGGGGMMPFSTAARHIRWFAPPAAAKRGAAKLEEQLEKLEEAARAPGMTSDLAGANTESFKALKDFLLGIKFKKGKHPTRRITDVVFYHSPDDKGNMQVAQARLMTSGGDCKKAVEKSLGELFKQVGLPGRFEWEEGYWDTNIPHAPYYTPPPAQKPVQGPKPRPEGPQGVSAPANAAGAAAITEGGGAADEQPVQAEKKGDAKEEDGTGVMAGPMAPPIEDAIRELDPLLEAVACVPWLDPADAEASKRRDYIKGAVVDELESRGWKVRARAVDLWAGRAEAAGDVDGLDPGTTQAVKSMVFHSKKLEAVHGLPQFLGE